MRPTKLLCATAIFFLPILAAHAEPQMIISSPQLKWMDAKDLPPGAKVAILAGNPQAKEHFIARIKLPANYIVPAHSHSIAEYDTVISGTYYMGEGKVADANKGVALNPGDFAMVPANNYHYGFTKSETILEISSDGPWGMNYETNG